MTRSLWFKIIFCLVLCKINSAFECESKSYSSFKEDSCVACCSVKCCFCRFCNDWILFSNCVNWWVLALARVEEKDIQKPRIAHLVVSHSIWGSTSEGILISRKSLTYSFREVIKVWLLNNDMLKRHLGDLALTSERGALHNTAEWSDNKIGNIDIEELDEIKDGLRNM